MRMDCTQNPLVRIAMVLPLLAALWVPATMAGEEPAKTLTITTINRIPLNGPGKTEDAESLYYLVDTAYPQDWQDEVEKSFKVSVDGQPATYQDSGGGFGGGTANAGFWVYLGRPGKKTIEVTLVKDGKTVSAEKEFTVPPEAALRMLGHYDAEAVFENEALKFLAYEVKDAAVTVNGNPVQAEPQPLKGFDGVSILTVPPCLKPGSNAIEYSGRDAQGKSISHKISLYYAAENKAKAGDRFMFTYGRIASKSGPFYYVNTDGEVLVQTGNVEWKTILKQDEKGWIGASEVFGHPILAKKAGAGGLALFVKSNFLLPQELDKKIQITVEP